MTTLPLATAVPSGVMIRPVNVRTVKALAGTVKPSANANATNLFIATP
jgi:hypothetical protein